MFIAFVAGHLSHSLFLSLYVLRNGNARRLDNVNDVDAHARADMVRIGHKLPLHVAGNDGGDDAAVGAADVSENTASVGLPLLPGVWILRHLAGSRCWKSMRSEWRLRRLRCRSELF